MMAATPEQKFNAAVKVIRGLPKNGAFQPSHELMLKFYAYFKQATEGPCTASKPGIWNIVNRRKWEAWSELGQMERETAMLLYVEELKNVSKHVRDTLYPPEIVETMPQTEQVAEFVDTLGAFYELIEEGTKGLPAKTNGAPDQSEEEKLQHSSCIGEMLKINNNEAKKGKDSPGDGPAHPMESAGNGVMGNGHESDDGENSGEEDLEEEEEEGEEEEEEGEEEKDPGRDDSLRVDSGSDTDEFCDTSDQMIQLPTQLQWVHTQAPRGASTPMDSKREVRVRFAPHVHTAEPPVAGMEERDVYDSSALLHNLSTSTAQMLTDRLALGSAAALPFPPDNQEQLSGRLSESLRVNNSLSSLDALAGDDIEEEAQDMMEEEATLQEADDVSGRTSAGHFDLVTSRGGGEEEMSTQAAGGSSLPAGRGGASSAAPSGRGVGRGTSGGTRRGRLPPGSGGGGYRGGGEGHQRGGSLDEQILLALLRMRQDMTDISNRLAALELRVQLQREEEPSKKTSRSSWWPFSGLSKTLVFLLFIWPFLAPVLIHLLCRRRRGGPR